MTTPDPVIENIREAIYGSMDKPLTPADRLRILAGGSELYTDYVSEDVEWAIESLEALLSALDAAEAERDALRKALDRAAALQSAADTPPSPYAHVAGPTDNMVLAGSMVDWNKYDTKEAAVRDIWLTMARNSPHCDAARDIKILLAQIDYLQEAFGEELSEEDAGIVLQIRQTWGATATEGSDNG